MIWSQLPVFHNDLIDPSIRSRVEVDGLYGFTGQEDGRLEKDDLEAILLRKSGSQVQAFVLNKWPEPIWECAWFVNPPVSLSPLAHSLFNGSEKRLQSVKALAHIHVFAKRKV